MSEDLEDRIDQEELEKEELELEEEIKEAKSSYIKDGCNENLIEWLRGQNEVCVTLVKNRFYNKILTLAKAHPDEVRIDQINQDGSMCCHIPLSYLHIYAPTKRELTEEEKEICKERLAKYRNSTTNNN